MMSRAERRHAAKVAKHKPQRNDKRKCGTLVDKAIWNAGRDSFKRAFQSLKISADQQCIASEDAQKIVLDVGFLLYIVLRAMELDQIEPDEETKIGLDSMKQVLCDVQDFKAITQGQRAVLIDGMDYLDAISDVLSDEAAAVAWSHVSRVTGIKK